jgi:hypothetical protein
MFFRDHFKLIPVGDLAEMADKFTRNEIMSKNEIRQIIGMKPSDDPKADQLINSNISQGTDPAATPMEGEQPVDSAQESGSVGNTPISELMSS